MCPKRILGTVVTRDSTELVSENERRILRYRACLQTGLEMCYKEIFAMNHTGI